MAAQPREPAVNQLRLFSGAPQYENFAQMQRLLPTTLMRASSAPYRFPVGEPITLPNHYAYAGGTRNLHALLGGTHTAALLVLKDGEIRYEDYALSGGRNVQWMSMSVAKSFISALVGMAMADGFIASLDDPITRYVSTLAGTAYDGVRIKDVLQMSSGARWYEDYSDPSSEIFRLSEAMGGGGSFDAFMKTMVRERSPGTLCLYDSADTQALGMLVAAATDRSISGYMQEKLSEPLGMESSGYWIIDSAGREMAYGGLLLTARDFAKLGELYRCNGKWRNRQLIPAEYVAASTRADAPHLQPGAPQVSGHAFGPGYGYQWWLPQGDQGDYCAIGVYNQYVYVDPARGTVIVKLSANPAYGTTSDEAINKDVENIEALRAISRQFG